MHLDRSSFRIHPGRARAALLRSLALALLSALCLHGPSLPAQGGAFGSEPPVLDLATYPKGTLGVLAAGTRHDFDIWVADTPERQRQGLMFVRDLPASQGMLFVNESPRISTFWMKNTYIPLDMLFIDARGRIVAIFANATPLSLDPVGPSVPVRAVLELRGGEAARRGIRKGDRVLHHAFRSG
jgi:uncharacterized membrane protein (UPF0127 family)